MHNLEKQRWADAWYEKAIKIASRGAINLADHCMGMAAKFENEARGIYLQVEVLQPKMNGIAYYPKMDGYAYYEEPTDAEYEVVFTPDDSWPLIPHEFKEGDVQDIQEMGPPVIL